MKRPDQKKIDQTLAALRKSVSEMLEPLDIPGNWTQRQRDDYEGRRSALLGTISRLGAAARVLDKLVPTIEADEKWLDFLRTSRERMSKELVRLDANDRDVKVLGRIHGLKVGILMIDRGFDFRNEMLPATTPLDDLMKQSGFEGGGTLASTGGAAWRGDMPLIEWRLKGARRQAEEEIGQVDVAMRDAAVLLRQTVPT